MRRILAIAAVLLACSACSPPRPAPSAAQPSTEPQRRATQAILAKTNDPASAEFASFEQSADGQIVRVCYRANNAYGAKEFADVLVFLRPTARRT